MTAATPMDELQQAGRLWVAGWLLLVFFVSAGVVLGQAEGEPPDVLSIEPDLVAPEVMQGEPAAGMRVLQSLPDYAGTEVRHALYLPTDWSPGKTYPIIVEYTGNGGTVADGTACQGFGISGGEGFVWVCLPFVSADGKTDMQWWWGDPDRTADYAEAVVQEVCDNWGGDPNAVILTGHSRGAIACNYIGLRSDSIAQCWLATIAVSHYDNRLWKMSEDEYVQSPFRLRRLGDRPHYVCGEHQLMEAHRDPKLLEMVRAGNFESFADAKEKLNLVAMTERERIREFIATQHPAAEVTFSDFPWVNHTVEWVLRDTSERRKLRTWVKGVLESAGVPAPKGLDR